MTYFDALLAFAFTYAVLWLAWHRFFAYDARSRVDRVLTGLDADSRQQMVKDPPPIPKKDGVAKVDNYLFEKRRN
jgi:hypothetical protein